MAYGYKSVVFISRYIGVAMLCYAYNSYMLYVFLNYREQCPQISGFEISYLLCGWWVTNIIHAASYTTCITT